MEKTVSSQPYVSDVNHDVEPSRGGAKPDGARRYGRVIDAHMHWYPQAFVDLMKKKGPAQPLPPGSERRPTTPRRWPDDTRTDAEHILYVRPRLQPHGLERHGTGLHFGPCFASQRESPTYGSANNPCTPLIPAARRKTGV
jgi:hypothetical protein